ncbi:MAG: 1-acyl-sn-glycerol-3-phosphate acyltransferase [Anaeroplasmataceae bacterium]|nr:1-acyl-sn-glycerol-3-phosphate acyltransferase [Anaeroplasmataceae bacterium]
MKKERSKPNLFLYFWVKQTIFQLLLLSRTRVKIIGKELIDSKKRYLVVTNHISAFDPMIAIARLGLKPLLCVSKIENFRIPICGPFIHKAGFIALDRNDAHSGVQMVRKATNYLEKDYGSIYICPEGTRSKTGKLLPFHPGSFKIATKAQADIIIGYIENTNLISKNFPFKGTKTTLKILKVIPKEEVLEKSTKDLALEAQEWIQREKENR